MTRPIRVAHVVGTAGATGVESHLLALLPSFDRARVEATLFVPGPGILVERLRARGIPVEEGAPTRKLAFGEVAKLARRLRGSFDLVHAHGPRATFWAARAARAAGIPMVATVHELRWRSLAPGIKRELWVALEGNALHRAARVVAVSNAARRELIARWPRLEARTSTVYGSAPVLLDTAAAPPRSARSGVATLRFVSVGRFERTKGYDLLFAALARFAGAGEPFALSLVGGGPLETELRRLATRLGLEDRIRWLAGDVDIPRLLADSDAFVSATRSEMFGIAVLEAMAMGLPVLAPAVGSLPELIEDGVSGRLVAFAPEGTLPERIAGILASWARDPAERERLGAGAARRAREHFLPARLAASVTRLYEDLVSAR